VSHNVRVLCTPGTASGFRLAGFTPIEVENPGAAADRLTRLLENPETGVVLIDQGLLDALPETLHRELRRRPLPMVVPFPGPQWQPSTELAEGFIAELLRRAIGYRVRLT